MRTTTIEYAVRMCLLGWMLTNLAPSVRADTKTIVDLPETIAGIQMRPNGAGLAWSDANIWRTLDFAATWKAVPLPPAAADDECCIDSAGLVADGFWFIKRRQIYIRYDSTRAWRTVRPLTADLQNADYVYTGLLIQGKNMIVTGAKYDPALQGRDVPNVALSRDGSVIRAVVLTSANSGRTWTLQTLPYGQFRTARFPAGNIQGDIVETEGNLYYRESHEWKVSEVERHCGNVTVGTGSIRVLSTYQLSEHISYAALAGGCIVRRNGKSRWTNVGRIVSAPEDIVQLVVTTATTMCAISSGNRLFCSRDGGNQWTRIADLPTKDRIAGLARISHNVLLLSARNRIYLYLLP